MAFESLPNMARRAASYRSQSVLSANAGIVTVSPGKGGLGTFAPLLDPAGNSIKGQLATKFLSQRLGMDLFVSEHQSVA